MRHSKRFLAVYAAAILVLIAVGCATYTTREAPPPPGDRRGDVNLIRDIQFEDIPGPQEYDLISSESYSFQGSTFRSAYLVYEGPVEWRQALDFYRTQMPQLGWTAEDTERGFDVRVLRFLKGQERAIVTVRQLRNGSRTEIQVDNAEKSDLLLKGKMPSK